LPGVPQLLSGAYPPGLISGSAPRLIQTSQIEKRQATPARNHLIHMSTRLCTALLCLVFLRPVCGQPLDAMLVLEASPGTEHINNLIRAKVLRDGDRAGVIAFDQRTAVLQPLTSDREKIDDAVRRAGSCISGSVGTGNGVPYNINMTADLSSALQEACAELEADAPAGRRPVIVVWFGSDDLNLSRRLDSLKAAVRTSNARLYAIAVQRASTQPSPLGPPRIQASYPFPVLTARLMSELVEQLGGRIYKRNWDLKQILEDAR